MTSSGRRITLVFLAAGESPETPFWRVAAVDTGDIVVTQPEPRCRTAQLVAPPAGSVQILPLTSEGGAILPLPASVSGPRVTDADALFLAGGSLKPRSSPPPFPQRTQSFHLESRRRAALRIETFVVVVVLRITSTPPS